MGSVKANNNVFVTGTADAVNGSFHLETIDNMKWSNTNYKSADFFSMEDKLPFFACQVTSSQDRDQLTMKSTRTFRVGQLVTQQRVAATDNVKNRSISLPRTGLDLQFKIPHGRKWYDLAQYRRLDYITSKYSLPILVDTKRPSSTTEPDMTSLGTLTLSRIYGHQFLAVNYIENGIISQEVTYIDVTNDVMLYYTASVDDQSDDHIMKLVNMYDRSCSRIDFNKLTGPLEIIYVPDTRETSRHADLIVSPSMTVSRKESFTKHNQSRTNETVVPPTTLTKYTTGLTPSGRTLRNTGDDAKEDIAIIMQVEVQPEQERWRKRRTEVVSSNSGSLRSTNSAMNSRISQNIDNNNEIITRINGSRGKQRTEKKRSSLAVLRENDVSGDVTKVLDDGQRDQNDNKIDTVLSRDITMEIESRDTVQSHDNTVEIESRDQVDNTLPDRIEFHEDNETQTVDRRLRQSHHNSDIASTRSSSKENSTKESSTVLLAGNSRQAGFGQKVIWDERRAHDRTTYPAPRSIVAQVPPYRHEETLASDVYTQRHQVRQDIPGIVVTPPTHSSIYNETAEPFKTCIVYFGNESDAENVSNEVTTARKDAVVLERSARDDSLSGVSTNGTLTTSVPVRTDYDQRRLIPTQIVSNSSNVPGNYSSLLIASDGRRHAGVGVANRVSDDVTSTTSAPRVTTSTAVKVDQRRVTVQDFNLEGQGQVQGQTRGQRLVRRLSGSGVQPITFQNRQSPVVSSVWNHPFTDPSSPVWNHPPSQSKVHGNQRSNQRPDNVVEPRRNRNDERVKFASNVMIQTSDGRAQRQHRIDVDVDEPPLHRLGNGVASHHGERAFRPRLASEYVVKSPQYSSNLLSTGTLPSKFRRVKPQQQQQQYQEYDMDLRLVSKQRHQLSNTNSDIIATSPSPQQPRLNAQVSAYSRASSMFPSSTMNKGVPVLTAPSPARFSTRGSGYNVTGSTVTSSSVLSGSRRDREETRYRETSSPRNQWQR